MPQPTSRRYILISYSHLRPCLPIGLFPSGFPTKTLYAPLVSTIRAICPNHLILLCLITRTKFGEGSSLSCICHGAGLRVAPFWSRVSRSLFKGIFNGGNAIPKHAGPEANGSFPTIGLTLLWARNTFGGNFIHWLVSRKEAGRIWGGVQIIKLAFM